MRAALLFVLLFSVSLASLFNLAAAETITITGTVHSGVEAGCWLIRADGTGTEYLLIGPPDALRVDGLHAQVTGEIKTAIASYCMQGSITLQVTSYSIFTGSTTLQSTCTTTWTHTGGYLPVPYGVCQEIVPTTMSVTATNAPTSGNLQPTTITSTLGTATAVVVIPGFPIEAILLGIALGLVILILTRLYV